MAALMSIIPSNGTRIHIKFKVMKCFSAYKAFGRIFLFSLWLSLKLEITNSFHRWWHANDKAEIPSAHKKPFDYSKMTLNLLNFPLSTPSNKWHFINSKKRNVPRKIVQYFVIVTTVCSVFAAIIEETVRTV